MVEIHRPDLSVKLEVELRKVGAVSVFEKVKERAGLSFDPDALAEKYRLERDKRVREDAEEQFIRVSLTENSHYFTGDPFAPSFEREPISDTMDYLVIGAGWVGLVAAARLIQAGHESLRIVEGGSDFGGTWYWNRYPGAQCDVMSYLYLPLLEDTGYVPKERFSFAPEIFEHAQRIGDQFGLYDKAVLQTWVTELRWNDHDELWDVSTHRGDSLRARNVVLGTGSAPRPRLPGVPGIESFQGHTFHTSRWDYDYTGGGPEGRLSKLADRTVAVIGTGATAIQCVPHVAASAQHTYVFQRTPSTVSPRGNAPTDPEWAASLQPGWQKELMREFQRMIAGEPPRSAVMKNETMLKLFTTFLELTKLVEPEDLAGGGRAEILQIADYINLEAIRQRVEDEVTNPSHAELLKPWYNLMCKRPTFNDEYLPAFNRDNVTLVDVSGARGVQRITETGLVANGQHYEVDCIIYASGFEITTDFERRLDMPIFGRGGMSIYDHWSEGMRTMHGLMVHGFPNFYTVGGLFGFTLGLNYSAVIEDQVSQVVHIADELRSRGLKTAEPTRAAEEAWIAEQTERPVEATPLFLGGAADSCTPGYYNQEGRPMSARRDPRRDAYAKGGLAYVEKLEQWRTAGDLDGLILS
jgi:cyclohexanone monooxygenase